MIFLILAMDEKTLATLIVPAFYQQPDTANTNNVPNKLSSHGNVLHSILLYAFSGVFIYLPMGVILQYLVYTQNTQSSLYLWYSAMGYGAGAFLYIAFVTLYYRVSCTEKKC